MYVLHVFEITKKFKENKKLPLKIQHNFSKLTDTIVQDSFYTISREKGIMQIKVQRKLFLHPSGLTRDSLMLLHQEV